ncbi:MAG: DUF2852 domain-containing protein [Parvularculaceae bacterium]
MSRTRRLHRGRSLRPEWTGTNILLMVLGFMIFPPVGLFMIAYMIWGRSWGLDFSRWQTVQETADRAGEKFKSAFDGKSTSSRSRPTGNYAFDDWRDSELKRMEEERRKLREAEEEFDKYVQELRRARDREEFDQFRENWDSRKEASKSPTKADTKPDDVIEL